MPRRALDQPHIIGGFAALTEALQHDVWMDDLLREIRAAIAGNAWVLALFGTLALPDICAALGSSNGQTTGKKYKNWVRDNLGEKYPKLDPDELWQMRCSLLHQGNSSTATYERVIFMVRTNGNVFHNNVIGEALNLDLEIFCEDVLQAVERWLAANTENRDVIHNSESVVRWHRGGISPYVVGVDVLT